MSDAAGQAPGGLRQFRLLLKLWWLHLRRRPMRVGETPKLSGVPAMLLISAISSGYMTLIAWQSVARNVHRNSGSFVLYAFGIMLLGLSQGISKGVGKLQLAGTRNDSFLDSLPLRVPARLGLRLADTITVIPLALAAPLAAVSTRGSLGAAAIIPTLLGGLAYLSSFVAGSALIAWGRALWPATAGRLGGYLGLGSSMAAVLLIMLPLGELWNPDSLSLAARFTRAWIGPDSSLPQLYAALSVWGALAYGALAAAERFGYDQMDPQIRTPKPSRRFRDRIALERVMLRRQGGRVLVGLYVLLIVGALWFLVFRPPREVSPQVLLFATGFVAYLAAIAAIGQAGRAAREDRQARSFLATLPLSPYQVLEGKTRALRVGLIPALLLLLVIGAASVLHADSAHLYRIVLTFIGLIVVVEGAVSIAFLSTGIGVVGIGGVQTTGFSTQILMLPLLATVLAPNDWSATTAFIALIAVVFESHRAARTNVRWVDDPADDVERETTVWRALLASSAFFAVQGLTFQVLSLFELSMGYALAIAFASSALVLALMTYRNEARLERPRFLPSRAWYWPLGIAAGAASGLLAREFAKFIPAQVDSSMPDFTGGETIALAITTTVIAPLAEEYFFRGWLQRAVEAELPADRKQWAFVIGAVAFALAHFGTYGAPQLILGLLSGWIYARSGGLFPCMLAHALHNGVVLALGV